MRLLVASLGLVLIVAARGALMRQDWLQVLLGWLGPLAPLLGGLFPGMMPAVAAPALIVLAVGCVLLGMAIPVSGAGPWRPPEPTVAPPTAANQRAPIALLVMAAGLCAVAALLLRRQPPPNISIALWLAALSQGGIAAVLLDRRRRTPLGSPLRDRTDWLIAAALFGGCLLLVGHDIAHWRWAGTPDEANFFPFARDLANGTNRRFLLEEPGMYGVHPILSSYYQALFMRLFGMDIFGWRLSSAFALAVSLPFVYVFGRELWGRRFGVWAAALFGATPLAVGFAHFGYNNVQVYPIVTAALALLPWSIRRRSVFGYYLTGAVAGFGVFTFYPARLTLPLLLVLAFCLGERPWARGKRGPWCMLVLAVTLAATPCLVHPVETARRMFGQTAFRRARIEPAAAEAPPPPSKLARLARHLTVAVLHPAWYPSPSHFQRPAVVDPLQGVLAIVGLVLVWKNARRHRGSRFLAVAYPLAALTVGAVSQHDNPPLTRLFFLCPFTSMLAAEAIGHGLGVFAGLRARRRLATAIGSMAVAASAVWGMGTLRYNVYVVQHGYGEGTTSEVVRFLRAVPDWRVIYVQRVPTYMNTVDLVVAQFGMADRFEYVRDSDVALLKLPQAGERNVLVVHDLPEGDGRLRLEAEMARRFPGTVWVETAPAKRWSMRAAAVGRAGPVLWEPPPLPDRSDLGSLLFGFLDW